MKPPRTPARDAHPRKPFSQPVYDGGTLEDVKVYPILPDDTVTTIGKKLAPEFYGKYWHEIAKETTEGTAPSERMAGFLGTPQPPTESGTPVIKWHTVKDDDLFVTCWLEVAEKIAQVYGISLQELGVTNQTTISGAQPRLMSKPMPLWTADPMLPAVEMPVGFDGWTESDFIDRREMFALMETGQEWTFAQCKWLENKAEQFEKADLDQMFPGGVHKWHFYARTHCPRYKAEQPRYIQERDTRDNAS